MGESTPTDNPLAGSDGQEETLADLLPAYALGLLDAGDRQRVEDWLTTEAAAADEVEAYQAIVDRLPLLADDMEPPAGLRQRVLDAAAPEAATALTPPAIVAPLSTEPTPVAPTPIAQARPRRPAWYAQAGPWVLAASILLAVSIGLGMWNAALRGQLDDQQRLTAAAASQLAAVQAEVAALQAQPRVAIYTVRGTPDAPNATGEVVYVPQQQAAFLTISNLPAVPNDRAYQVWFIEQGRPVSAGMLPTAPQHALQQGAARLNADLSKYQAIAVSVEPIGGSQQPTGAVVVTAPLSPGNA